MLPKILGILALLTLLGLVYDKIYLYGYNTASTKYEIVLQEYKDKHDAKLEKLEYGVANILNATNNTNTVLSKEFTGIRLELKKQPLVSSKNGECLISQKFLDARLLAIDKANQR